MQTATQQSATTAAASSPERETIIATHGLTKRYGAFVAVDGIDVSVFRNEIFGILGPNGAGKTTTLEMIEGLRDADGGSIQVAGVDVVADPDAVKRVIGVQLQSTALFDHLTARELVHLFAALSGGNQSKQRVNELLRLVTLEEKAGAYADQLSGGQRQRLSIALALANDPSVLFLDEPTTGLDPQARRNLWDLVQQLRADGKTIVLTTHYMEEAEVLCDRVAVMDHGKIIACDTPQALIQSLGSGGTIRARLATPLSETRIATLPQVRRASIVDDQLEINSDDVQVSLVALLQFAADAGARLENLSSTSATLEDVFLTYTGRSLRE